MTKDIIKISTVAFNAKWGDKDANLNRMLGYIETAAAEGSQLVVFPEMALTGYDDEAEKPKAEKMQSLLAETVPGPSSLAIAAKAQELGVYVAFGLPERDGTDPATIYNSACVCGPDGIIGSYRKIHLPAPEPAWATRGEEPFIFDTPWGPVGLAICYDTYCFPELMRYYAAKGCRLYINCTALAKCHGPALGTTTVEAGVITNQIYVVSANLANTDLYNVFWGGSSIIGPSTRFWETEYYAGLPFTDPRAMENKMYSAVVDLSLATREKFEPNPLIDGATDFRPALYRKLYTDLLQDPKFQEPMLSMEELNTAAEELVESAKK
ncbi:MAG: carbon-nitrogen hydrolase family protein [Acidipropionibacterium sp.]|jgi:predicted amidohydrolase|nr:carbon-nitrogen hydrolase family protein [Acidipropionibacterium sp.]